MRAGWRLPEAQQAPGGLRGGRGIPAHRAHAAAAAPPLRLPRGSAPRSTPRLPPAAAAAALRELRGLCPMWQEAMMMRRRRRYLLERAEQAGGGCGASGEQSRSRDWLYESYYCMSQQHPLIVFLLLIVMGACLALLAVFFASGLVRDALPVWDPLHPRVPGHPRCRRPASPLQSPRWHRRAVPGTLSRGGRDGAAESRCCSSCGGKLVAGGAEVAAGTGEPPPELCCPIFRGDAGAAATRLMERKLSQQAHRV